AVPPLLVPPRPLLRPAIDLGRDAVLLQTRGHPPAHVRNQRHDYTDDNAHRIRTVSGLVARGRPYLPLGGGTWRLPRETPSRPHLPRPREASGLALGPATPHAPAHDRVRSPPHR